MLSIAVDDSDELVAHDRHALDDLIEIPTPDQMKSFETDPIAAQHLFWETSGIYNFDHSVDSQKLSHEIQDLGVAKYLVCIN